LVEFSIEIDEEKPCDKAWHNRKKMQRSEQKSLAKTRTPRKVLNLTHSSNSMKKKEKKKRFAIIDSNFPMRQGQKSGLADQRCRAKWKSSLSKEL
jgi:beta-lactamase regulating signal transducer with metallopeptidase domain